MIPTGRKVSRKKKSQEKGFPGGSVIKNLPANAEDTGSIPESGISPGEGNGNPLQYSCLGNLMDKGDWQATVHGVSKRVRYDLGTKPTNNTNKSRNGDDNTSYIISINYRHSLSSPFCFHFKTLYSKCEKQPL